MSHIIQQKVEQPNKEAWIFDLANVVTDIKTLYRCLDLDPDTISLSMLQAKKQFPLRVPLAFINRMKKGDSHDPLLLQVLCDDNEMLQVAGYSDDPLQEQNNAIPGLLHKYHNRALLITKTACAINCRYCFRRHFPYHENQSSKKNLNIALNYIATHPELDEIILSGGDPLMAKDNEIAFLISELEKIPHIKRLRIHTRLAVVIPSRITQQLSRLFAQSRLQIIVVTHINHPNEIDNEVTRAIWQLKQSNVLVLNQSVMLKNINDNVEVLAQLSNKLFDSGILPYYIHLLDKVQGAAHFFVDDKTAKQLMKQLAEKVSGYLVPKLAREIGGEKSKRVLAVAD
ncbi:MULTISPECIES: EF-P beta-lysylation protein EpmB [unclassified Gilliamella]|uniref:EF-P beta-lysylation protein EpmB n=1 Tax=unclassified Gilliamella TaxID=2685620 RepID=UPI00226AF4E5|nr:MULTISPECIES: EF-P beta-lysylation protein EpmB [unclassified Gilliamella]MCX8600365.1 EF-P beta-lysylation protein EpmB [Gilliamella sp. B3722]MCX8609361.1 EF-P beta-lysylation protein EpmB [Gilliamella sp. B3771]MCX8609580.1 EF-P beta-lysylation protein EpmB [Gilliamella sp. B3891]MCX8612331.1 EF-P beta-lysylation protein EpmB [Gilliamella sp. B3773]MCX8615751.1 EF-P beta-lysylation protein EpmB [Gilliamella sp. B3770]